jgi:hypothetical protein
MEAKIASHFGYLPESEDAMTDTPTPAQPAAGHDAAADTRTQLLDEAKRRLDRYDMATHSCDEDEWADLVFRLIEIVKQQRTTVVDAQSAYRASREEVKQLLALSSKSTILDEASKRIEAAERDRDALREALVDLQKRAKSYRKSRDLVGPAEYHDDWPKMKVWQKATYDVGKEFDAAIRSALAAPPEADGGEKIFSVDKFKDADDGLREWLKERGDNGDE